MEVYVALYRGKEHESVHSERSHILGVFDSEQQAESAVEKMVNNGMDFRRIIVVPFEINKIYQK